MDNRPPEVDVIVAAVIFILLPLVAVTIWDVINNGIWA